MKIPPYILGLLPLLWGCASRVEVPCAAVPAPRQCLLTLIRIEPEPAPTELLIYMHGELAAVIGNGSFVTLALTEGTCTLTFDWEDSPLQFEESIVLEPDLRPEKYLSLVRKFDIPEISKQSGASEITMEETLGFIELSPLIGERVIEQLDPELSYVDEKYQ